ncbi:enoyl-CoA hydratase-related protein [Nocardia pseudovaccinii]|uniref:enoyl-CoA hydratase-related protein n=1 Tax=Nocardia pseudovaccinii TaxID=189540 RepID=UPI0007A3ADFB|nr:enoyl-CoA hydratase-related protein [Nocardia pseudovaccinii]
MSDAIVERDGRVVRIVLNRPESRNALTFEMLETLVDTLDSLAKDSYVQVVLIEGAGADFSVGADMSVLATMNQGDRPQDAPSPERIRNTYRIPVLLHSIPQITVAAVRGACAGAGFGIACACDVRLCDDTALFRTAFARVGVAGDMCGAWSLPRIVGSSLAYRLYLFNERVEAQAAAAMGLATRVFDKDAFDAALSDAVDQLAAMSPLALRGMKRNFLDAQHLGLAEYEKIETGRHEELLATEDIMEAALAFLEKRTPRFQGR